MKFHAKKYSYVAIWIVILVLGTSSSAWAKKNEFQKIFFFGDSISDSGNVHALTGLTSIPPFEVIPSAPYESKGGQFTFTSGKTWTQEFAHKMHAKKSGEAALQSPGKNGNYAFGGARARPDDPFNPSLVPSGTEQIDLYLADHIEVDEKALYVIQFGGNDVRDALGLLLFDPELFPMAESIIESAVLATLGMIDSLYQMGARNFLVVNVPDIGLSPAIKMFGDTAIATASFLVASYNFGLDSGLQGLKLLPDISIKNLDLHLILTAVIDSPEDFKITNTEETCLIFFVEKDAECHKTKKFLFWDGIHPTATIHKLVGKDAAKLY